MFGMLKGIAGFFMGTNPNATKLIDGATSGLDAMFFTPEEKSVANQKVLDFKLEYAKTTQGQNVTRRFLALMIAAIFLHFLIVGFYAEIAGFLNIAKVAKEYAKILKDPFDIVLAFYFLTHVVGKLKGK